MNISGAPSSSFPAANNSRNHRQKQQSMNARRRNQNRIKVILNEEFILSTKEQEYLSVARDEKIIDSNYKMRCLQALEVSILLRTAGSTEFDQHVGISGNSNRIDTLMESITSVPRELKEEIIALKNRTRNGILSELSVQLGNDVENNTNILKQLSMWAESGPVDKVLLEEIKISLHQRVHEQKITISAESLSYFVNVYTRIISSD